MTTDSLKSRLARAAFAATVVVLSGCGVDPQGGYRPVERSGSQGALSFNEANARCWEASMNIAGFAATAPQQEAYNTCMVRNGWEDPRRRAREQPVTVPGGR